MNHGDLYGHLTEAQASWLGTVHYDVVSKGNYKHNDWWYGEHDPRPIKQRRKEFYEKKREQQKQVPIEQRRKEFFKKRPQGLQLNWTWQIEEAFQRLFEHKDTDYCDLAELRAIRKISMAQGHITSEHSAYVGWIHGIVIMEGKYQHNDWWTGFHNRPEQVAKVEAAKAEQERLEDKLLKLLSSPIK